MATKAKSTDYHAVAQAMEEQIGVLREEELKLPTRLQEALNAGDFEVWQQVQFRQQRIPVEVHGLEVKKLESRIEAYRAEAEGYEAQVAELRPEFERAEAALRAAKETRDRLAAKIAGFNPFGTWQIVRGLERELEALKHSSVEV